MKMIKRIIHFTFIVIYHILDATSVCYHFQYIEKLLLNKQIFFPIQNAGGQTSYALPT